MEILRQKAESPRTDCIRLAVHLGGKGIQGEYLQELVSNDSMAVRARPDPQWL